MSSRKQKVSVEILEFISPDANRKSLFISGIPYMLEDALVVRMQYLLHREPIEMVLGLIQISATVFKKS